MSSSLFERISGRFRTHTMTSSSSKTLKARGMRWRAAAENIARSETGLDSLASYYPSSNPVLLANLAAGRTPSRETTSRIGCLLHQLHFHIPFTSYAITNDTIPAREASENGFPWKLVVPTLIWHQGKMSLLFFFLAPRYYKNLAIDRLEGYAGQRNQHFSNFTWTFLHQVLPRCQRCTGINAEKTMDGR